MNNDENKNVLDFLDEPNTVETKNKDSNQTVEVLNGNATFSFKNKKIIFIVIGIILLVVSMFIFTFVKNLLSNQTNVKVENAQSDNLYSELNSGEMEYTFEINDTSSLPLNLAPDKYVAIYMTVKNDNTLHGKLLDHLRVLALKDSAHNLIDSSSKLDIKYIVLAIPDDYYDLVQSANGLEDVNLSLVASTKGEIKTGMQQLIDYIETKTTVNNTNTENDNSTKIAENTSDSLAPRITQVGDVITISYSSDCANVSLCTYEINNGGVTTTTNTQESLNLQQILNNGSGTLTASMEDAMGNVHNITAELPLK